MSLALLRLLAILLVLSASTRLARVILLDALIIVLLRIQKSRVMLRFDLPTGDCST